MLSPAWANAATGKVSAKAVAAMVFLVSLFILPAFRSFVMDRTYPRFKFVAFAAAILTYGLIDILSNLTGWIGL